MKRLLFFLIAIVFAIQGWTQTPATLPYLCDFEDPNEISQWNLSNSTCVNRWAFGQAVTATGFSGTSMYISNDSISNAYTNSTVYTVVASRAIMSDGSGFYQLSFDFNCQGESSYDFVKVYVVPNDTNYVGASGSTPFYAASAFTSPRLVAKNGTKNYLNLMSGRQFYDIPASLMGASGTTVKLIFVWRNDGSGGAQPPAAIDNISFTSSNCTAPTTLAVLSSSITTSSADITWVADASNTGFTLEYKLQSQTWDDAIIVQSAVSPYSIQVLNPNTPYDVRVKADCSGSESSWSFTNFRTACGQINTLPFEESFDTYGTGTGVFLTCWGRVTSTPTTYPNISTTNSSSPGSMYMYAASGAHNYIATPEFDASIPINTLTAFFKLYKGSAAYNITVGVMSDPNDTTTFDSITNLSPTSNSTWQTFGVNFANYTGIGQYIAFKVQGFGAANGMYIDDLEIDISPVCSIPTGLTDYDSLATSNSITLDWDGADDANVLSWIVEYKPLDATIWQSQDAYSHPFVLTGLQSSIVYQVRLYAICSSGDTTYATNTINVGMPCEAITTIPWNEGFEGVWFVAYGLNTGTHPWCWTNINGGASTSYLWRKTTTSSDIHSGSGALQMYAANTTGQLGDWFISPTISLSGNERLRFWAKGYSTYTDILSVKILDVTTNGIVDAEADTSLFVDIMPNTIIPASDWIEYEVNLNQFTGDYQIAFVRNTTGGYYLNIDDVSITELPNCVRPSDITISSLESNSATISWTPGNTADASWYICYKASTATDYDSVLVNSNPYQLQGLNPQTIYNYYLRTDCGNEFSEATSVYSFTTPCETISVFPYTEGFDSLGAAGAFPPCWARPVIYSTYPKTSTTASRVHSAPASLEIHSAVGSPTYAVTPPMGADINTLRVRFWAMAESITSSGTIEVGVMSDPSNLLTFESVQTIQPTNTSYNQYEVLFSGTTLTGMNRFIAFRQNTVSAIYYYWIDDIEVDYIPACSKPASVVASNITTTSADITWAPANATDAAWWLYYQPSTASTFDSVYVTSTPSYSFTTLSPNTLYNIYIVTDCGTELSEPTAVSNFRTNCAAISTLPFLENFDTYGTGTTSFPSCWTKITTYSSYPYLTTTYASSPASMYFYTTSGTYNIATTPPFDSSIPINTLMASFKLRKSNATSNITVGVMTDPTNASTFDSLTTVSPSTTGVFEQFEVHLSSYTGTGQYIAFRVAYNTTTNYIYMDDLSVNVIPLCPDTYSLQVASATSTDITLTWNETNSVGQGWEVSYDAVGTGFDPSTGIIIPVADAVGVPPYTIPGLTPSTPYSFAVRQACGGNWSNVVTVNTMGLPAQLPYTCDFEDVDERNSWSISNGGATNKWFIGTAVSATPITGNSLYISNDNGVSNAYTLTTISTVVASRLIEFDGSGGYTLTFDSRLGGESSFDYIKVYVVDQDTTFVGDASTPYYGSNSYSTGVVLFNGANAYFNNVSNPTTVNNHSVVIPYQGVAGTVRKLMFVWRNDVSGGTTPPASIDNITITPITCAAPVLTISNIAQTTADASWTATATDAAWWLYWKQASATNYDSVYLTGVPSYSFTTLTANTAYNAYVRLDCGTELSNPSAIVDFRTTCAPVATLPYIENFDTYGTASNTLPACWNKITTYSTYPYLSTTNNSAPASLYFYATTGTYNIATTPPIDVSIPINTLMATFQMRKGSATSNLIVGVMTDPTDATTFDSITTVSPSATVVWEEFEVNFSSYTGTGTYIAFKSQYNTATNYFYLDDLVIDIIPSCARPISATATNITGTTADLSWTPGNASDFAWKIYYRPSGTSDWDSVMVTNNPYNLTGLLPSTNYEVGISTDCGTGEFSNMRLMNFRTQCGAITSLPWTDNFDSYGTGTTIFPGCWTRNTTYADRPHVHATSYSSPGSLYFYSATAGTYNIAATPMFDQTINISSVRASFMFRNMNATDTLKVGVMTDPSQESTWVEVGRVSHSSAQVWVADTISFANYTGTGQYIAFRIDRYSTTSQWSWMDDLVIEYDVNSNPCPQPTNVVVIPSNASANVTWSIGAESAWEVRLGTTGTPIAVSTPSYTIPALSPGTTYTVYVRSNCGTGYSAWVSAQFTTNTDPTPPTVTTAVPTTMISQTTAVFNGTYVQTTDAILTKGFEYKAASAATWTNEVVTDGTTPFTFSPTGLVANTAYEVKAYVTTATFNTTYGNTVAFTTLAIVPPTVTTDSVKVLSETSATFYGKITEHTESIEARGFEYKLSSQAWADAINISATGVTTISATPTTLTLGSYNVRAYARTLSGTEYGQVLTFQTQGLDGIDGQDISIMMYPNPATSQTNLIVNGINGETKIILSDVQGRILNTMSAKPVSGTIEQTIDLNNLAKGVYYIRIQNSDINRTQKLIVK